jgi:hypothetical protein
MRRMGRIKSGEPSLVAKPMEASRLSPFSGCKGKFVAIWNPQFLSFEPRAT